MGYGGTTFWTSDKFVTLARSFCILGLGEIYDAAYHIWKIQYASMA
jgi:hypothetical protein